MSHTKNGMRDGIENIRTILAIDLKCFYASVECLDRQLDPFSTPLVVADKERGSGTIVLAVSPFLKTLGWKSRQRVYELPPYKDLIFAPPRMARYIQKSAEVVAVFLEYVDEKDIHVYSIDESFLDITEYLIPAHINAISYARRIMKRVKKKTGLTVTCGIGENIFMAKAAMDIEAKKNPDFLARWTAKDIPIKLWPVAPLSKMWGIGKRLEKRLNDLGFYTVGEIANSDIDFLKGKFGIIGEELFNHANGIDLARIGEIYIPESKSYSSGQVFYEDYSKEEGRTVIKDMVEELLSRLRQERVLTGKIHLYIGYTGNTGSISRGMRLQVRTDDPELIRESFLKLYDTYVGPDNLVRKIGLSVSDISSDHYYQNDLFTDWEDVEKRRRLSTVIDEIRKHYGYGSIFNSTGALKESTVKKRSKLIGGHKK